MQIRVAQQLALISQKNSRASRLYTFTKRGQDQSCSGTKMHQVKKVFSFNFYVSFPGSEEDWGVHNSHAKEDCRPPRRDKKLKI